MQKIHRRVTAERELRKHDELSALLPRTTDRVAYAREVTGKVTDRGVDLRERDSHENKGRKSARGRLVGSERSSFAALCITAGICEELLFRGFLLWYLTELMPLPLAVIGTVALFVGVHVYQGSLTHSYSSAKEPVKADDTLPVSAENSERRLIQPFDSWCFDRA